MPPRLPTPPVTLNVPVVLNTAVPAAADAETEPKSNAAVWLMAIGVATVALAEAVTLLAACAAPEEARVANTKAAMIFLELIIVKFQNERCHLSLCLSAIAVLIQELSDKNLTVGTVISGAYGENDLHGLFNPQGKKNSATFSSRLKNGVKSLISIAIV